MVFTAILCFALGFALIIVCCFLPTGNSSENSEIDNSVVDNETQQPNNSEENGVVDSGVGETQEPSDPIAPSDSDISSEPTAPVEPEPSPEVPVEPETPAEPEEPNDTVDTENSFVSSKDDPLLILANVDNPLPEDFEVGELETVQGNYKLDVRAASYARQMIADAKAEGITLQLCSSYRAKSLQQTLFDNKYNSYISNGWTAADAYAKTATIIAIPGTSEHQTGLCMDVVTPSYQVLDAGYTETDAAKWLAANAYKYGFILRYPKDKQAITKIIFEPWHYRFVGIENAKLIYDSGLCLEEYLATLD